MLRPGELVEADEVDDDRVALSSGNYQLRRRGHGGSVPTRAPCFPYRTPLHPLPWTGKEPVNAEG